MDVGFGSLLLRFQCCKSNEKRLLHERDAYRISHNQTGLVAVDRLTLKLGRVLRVHETRRSLPPCLPGDTYSLEILNWYTLETPCTQQHLLHTPIMSTPSPLCTTISFLARVSHTSSSGMSARNSVKSWAIKRSMDCRREEGTAHDKQLHLLGCNAACTLLLCCDWWRRHDGIIKATRLVLCCKGRRGSRPSGCGLTKQQGSKQQLCEETLPCRLGFYLDVHAIHAPPTATTSPVPESAAAILSLDRLTNVIIFCSQCRYILTWRTEYNRENYRSSCFDGTSGNNEKSVRVFSSLAPRSSHTRDDLLRMYLVLLGHSVRRGTPRLAALVLAPARPWPERGQRGQHRLPRARERCGTAAVNRKPP